MSFRNVECPTLSKFSGRVPEPSIVIAHRLSTIKTVDRIILIKKGDIIEQGSHNDLMEAGGHYAELYDTYFRHQSLAYIDEHA